MIIDSAVIKYLSAKAQCDITTPHGAAYLCNDIESVTGQRLSLNTVKRLTGVIPYSSQPRDVTLEILAHYAGCESWAQLMEIVSQSISVFDNDRRFMDMAQLPEESVVEISWSPNRRILLRHIHDAEYEVLESENSKILVSDILKLSQVAVAFPLMVHQVIRSGSDLGPYTAAVSLGINKLSIL